VPRSYGKVLPSYTIRIADDGDQPHPPNVPGNLLVRTDLPNAFFKGYYKCPDKILEGFSNLCFHTGDLAKVDKAGNVYFLGQGKESYVAEAKI
jgi:carnitine-CoA ligase